MSHLRFDAFFRTALQADASVQQPFEYQVRLACGEPRGHGVNERLGSGTECRSLLVNVPTGCGKTAAVVMAWLWNRIHLAPSNWPRRLVYCLPMRTLVEQTRANVRTWLRALNRARPEDRTEDDDLAWLARNSPIVLMGGEDADPNGEQWDLWPEKPAIIIGTQDMLLSRALNRGYAMSRYRWPIHFGLLNNDSLWVMDEVQLMGAGLGTACQLEAFRSAPSTAGDNSHAGGEGPRRNDSKPLSATWYLSATASRRLLITREWRRPDGDARPSDDEFRIELSEAERSDTTGELGRRRLATKRLEIHSEWNLEQPDVVERILDRHAQMASALAASNMPADAPRRTFVFCNTVKRAVELHRKLSQQSNGSVDLVLLHSRFRPPDRQAKLKALEATGWVNGQIVVTTQVLEAGVDLSSAVLWAEPAPLPSVVQRLGRLNRMGEFGWSGGALWGWEPTAVFLGMPEKPAPLKEKKEEREKREADNARLYRPYNREDCVSAGQALARVEMNASPASIETRLRADLENALPPTPYSLHRYELLDFFDTDGNLSLGYTDVSPFVRGLDPDTDVYVLWRDWADGEPTYDGAPQREELCAVPIWEFKKLATWRQGLLWIGKERDWQSVSDRNCLPGATILLPDCAGGYRCDYGWTGDPDDKPVAPRYDIPELPTDQELLSATSQGWHSIEGHTLDVTSELDVILRLLALPEEVERALREAALWHDFGKSHPAWKEAVTLALGNAQVTIPADAETPLAKFELSSSPKLIGLTGRPLRREIYRLRRGFRPGIRHEVASALALRQFHRRDARPVVSPDLLAEYVVMAHHGRVRKVLRDELPRLPKHAARGSEAVCGVAEGDVLGDVMIQGTRLHAEPLSVECRKMGRSQDGSGAGHESWTRCVLRLLDRYGPLRLAYYEMVLRAADSRASKRFARRETSNA
jgi:CRISPR-associated endonuclease/helicase Cas3